MGPGHSHRLLTFPRDEMIKIHPELLFHDSDLLSAHRPSSRLLKSGSLETGKINAEGRVSFRKLSFNGAPRGRTHSR